MAHKYIVFYEDYLTFARVCKSWHSAAAAAIHGDYSNGPPSRFPSLLLPEKEKNDREFRELFLLSNKSIRKIRLSEVYRKVCRSSCGWLVTVGHDHATQLINPLSRETINLPKVDTFPGFNSIWYEGIQKLLIVTNKPSSLKLPLVVVLWGAFCKVGFWCPEDKKWIAVGQVWYIGMHDITYYNGQVYCFDKYNCIRACDVYGENPTAFVDVSRLPLNLYDKLQSMDRAYIIGLDESKKKKLLVVIRHVMLLDGWFHTCKTKKFILFAYDLEDEGWSIVNDLDDADPLYYVSTNGGGGDTGIYHLSDGTIEPNFTGEQCNVLTPPMWLESI